MEDFINIVISLYFLYFGTKEIIFTDKMQAIHLNKFNNSPSSKFNVKNPLYLKIFNGKFVHITSGVI